MATATDQTPAPVDVEKDLISDEEPTKSHKVPKGISDTLLKHSHDADAAMKAFEGMEGQVVELTEEKSKALLRKIDWHLMPVSPPPIQRPFFFPLSLLCAHLLIIIYLDHVRSLWLELSR